MGKSSKVFLAIEGGGSKGRAAVSWNRKTFARSLPVGLNPNDIDPGLLKRRFEALILPLLDMYGSSIGSLHTVAALAGAGRHGPQDRCRSALRAVLKPRCSRLYLEVTSDAEALLERFFALRDGIVLIAGTGSICLGVRHTRRGPVVSRAGGWGSYLDRGCGFRLGLGVLDAALRALDGRGEATPVAHLLCKRYDLDLDQVPGRFLPIRRDEVAGLAPIALEAASRGDPGTRKLVRRTVADLVDMVQVVAGSLSLVHRFCLVLSGGLFETPRVSRPFKRMLKRRLPAASLIQISDPLACLIHRY